MATNGPGLTYFGISNSTGTVISSAGKTADGIPIFTRASGWDFNLVAEAKPGDSGASVGRHVYSTTGAADFQMQSTRNLGNGSATVCDESTGGVPGVNPPDYSGKQSAVNAMNDLTCRFTSTMTPTSACTNGLGGIKQFVGVGTAVQFCYRLPANRSFPVGDTIVSLRILDVDGNPGQFAQIVIRIN